MGGGGAGIGVGGEIIVNFSPESVLMRIIDPFTADIMGNAPFGPEPKGTVLLFSDRVDPFIRQSVVLCVDLEGFAVKQRRPFPGCYPHGFRFKEDIVGPQLPEPCCSTKECTAAAVAASPRSIR